MTTQLSSPLLDGNSYISVCGPSEKAIPAVDFTCRSLPLASFADAAMTAVFAVFAVSVVAPSSSPFLLPFQVLPLHLPCITGRMQLRRAAARRILLQALAPFPCRRALISGPRSLDALLPICPLLVSDESSNDAIGGGTRSPAGLSGLGKAGMGRYHGSWCRDGEERWTFTVAKWTDPRLDVRSLSCLLMILAVRYTQIGTLGLSSTVCSHCSSAGRGKKRGQAEPSRPFPAAPLATWTSRLHRMYYSPTCSVG